MESLMSPIMDVFSRVWKFTARHASYITGLEETMGSLGTEVEKLKAIRDDVKLMVELEVEQVMAQSNQVERWLTRVEETEMKVNEISGHEIISSSENTCLRICRCRSLYELGKKSKKLLIVIQELVREGKFSGVPLQQLPYITEREGNVNCLIHEMGALKAKRDDVKLKVQLAEQEGMVQSSEVCNWLQRVGEIDEIVEKIIEENAQLTGSGLTNRSAYMVGKKATNTLQDVKDMINRGEFTEVAIQQLPDISEREKWVKLLICEMETLNARSLDVKRRVEIAEQDGMEQTNEVTKWLQRVDEANEIVKKIIEENAQLVANGSTCQSAYMVGLRKKAADTLEDLKGLMNRGEFSEVAIQQSRQTPTGEIKGWCEIPLGNINLFGNESNLENVMKALKDENAGIIGLYGMGGIGKTTLLSKINNELPQFGVGGFECALWVVASRNATIPTIQQAIIRKLKLRDEAFCNKPVDELCTEIYKNLKNRKYILMLGDVWKMIDLFEKVGIPKPDNQNKSKIIFTTRLKGVCSQMEAQVKIGVECLPWEKAWALFQKKVGKSTLTSQVESYARKVAKECNGLPLALTTIGRAMSGKDDPHDWLHALDQLQNYPAEIPELEEEVFPKLQLSYDYLADSTKQQCFLYCSLFPEDYNIGSDRLVNLWMGEGYLKKKHDIKKARDYGHSIIADLKRACLLESGNLSYSGTERVKMHDIIRDMALRIAGEKFLCLDNAELMRAKINDLDWNDDVQKMSLWEPQREDNLLERGQEKLTLTRECSKVSTLLCNKSQRFSVPGLLNFIPKVRVLDLSNSNIRDLPEAISNVENLEYLDISDTEIKRLPIGMKGLRKLKYLLMNFMGGLEFPHEFISSFTELLVFQMNWNPISEEHLGGLEKLQKIQVISICLNSAETMNFILKSEKLQLCTTHMHLRWSLEGLIWCPTNLRNNLESLCIGSSFLNAIKCSTPTTLMVFNCLCNVEVVGCDHFVELDFLAYAPSLIKLEVYDCSSIERILWVEETERVFLSLKVLTLFNLPCLEKICNKPLSFPSLETIDIEECPKLEQNPFNDMTPTNNHLRRIDGDRTWWDSVKWQDNTFKNHFSEFIYF